MNHNPHICIIAHNAYDELAGQKDSNHIGGIERQTSSMAIELARRGHEVSFITWDKGQPDGIRHRGVTVFKMCRADAGIRILRFVYPRWASLWSAMRRADADVYYYNRGDLGLGQVVMWARLHRRKCVYSVASEPDCDPRLPLLHSHRERIFYRYGLRRAGRIVAQTNRQQQMLHEGWRREAKVIPMPCQGPDEVEYTPPSPPAKRSNGEHRVIWVGRVSEEKRIEYLLDLAQRRRELLFDVVGIANADSTYSRQQIDRASRLNNVIMHGRIPWEQMGEMYRRAVCLCCTSSYEGFPNTFLEAWSHGIPIVTTFDPDGIVQQEGLGIVAHDLDEIETGVLACLREGDRWGSMSRKARAYYRRYHTFKAGIDQFEQLFMTLTEAKSPSGLTAPEDRS